MEEDVVWVILLFVSPVMALLTTIPIHPRFMKFPGRGNCPTPMEVTSHSYYNFYSPYGRNRYIYPIVTWFHWVFVFIALGIVPLWILTRVSSLELHVSFVLFWLVTISCILSLLSPIYLGPSWSDRKTGFEKEVIRRNIQRRDTLPYNDIKYRYD
jgi:hypothetical protein